LARAGMIRIIKNPFKTIRHILEMRRMVSLARFVGEFFNLAISGRGIFGFA
jgi:hypothetical protein